MRFALSVLGPALFSTLPMIGAVTALALAPAPACAQVEDDPNLEELEEQVLRQQIEQYLNEFARWDESKRRIVLGRERDGDEFEKAKGELGALTPILEMLLQRMIVRGDDGRLKIKEDFRLRPFAKIVQDYIAEGGIEDIERFQRYRNGDGENPFGKGIPPRAQKAVTGLLKALNDQASGPKKLETRPGEGEDERPSDRREARRAEERRKAEAERRAAEAERRAADAERRATEERRRAAEERRTARRTETPRPEPTPNPKRETRPESRDPLMGTLRERIAKRFDMEPAEVDELLRYVREMTEEARAEMARMRDEMREHMEEFRRSDRGKELDERMARLTRRAEDELRRFLESDETRERLSELEKRAMDFLASEEGQQMQRKLLEFLASEDGAKIRERLGEFMASDRGRELMKKLAERFGGGRPEPKATPRPDERRPIEAERRAAAEAKRAAEEKARTRAAEEKARADMRAYEEQKRKTEETPRRARDGRKPTEF